MGDSSPIEFQAGPENRLQRCNRLDPSFMHTPYTASSPVSRSPSSSDRLRERSLRSVAPSIDVVIRHFEGDLSEQKIVEQVSGTRKEEGKWWEKSIEGMGLQELEIFAQNLEKMRAQIES